MVCQPSSEYLSHTDLADLAFGLPSGGRNQATTMTTYAPHLARERVTIRTTSKRRELERTGATPHDRQRSTRSRANR
jgi:hypothetical protein